MRTKNVAQPGIQGYSLLNAITLVAVQFTTLTTDRIQAQSC